jgi:hypothetical protein
MLKVACSFVKLKNVVLSSPSKLANKIPLITSFKIEVLFSVA